MCFERGQDVLARFQRPHRQDIRPCVSSSGVSSSVVSPVSAEQARLDPSRVVRDTPGAAPKTIDDFAS
jgi:hypothetical protein